MKTKNKIILGLIAILVIMQFFRIDKENPPIDPKSDFINVLNPPIEVANIIKTSCYDCHSHESKYPWYTNVAPISWVMGNHINEGREHLNFSTWATYPEAKALHKLEEFYEEVEEGEMPLSSYTLIHKEAVLTNEQTKLMVDWVKSIPGVLEQD